MRPLTKTVFAITPSDTEVIRNPYKQLHSADGGDVAIRHADASVTTITMAAGATLPIAPSRIMSTGTTSAELFGMI